MRQLFARPVTALLTFVVGIALVSCFLLIRKSRPVTPPCDHTESTSKPAPTEERAAEKTPYKPSAEFFDKVGDLPEHDPDELRHFSINFVNERMGWLANGAKLWRTTDGGAHWELLYSKGKVKFYDTEYVDRFRFIDPNDGWMLVNNHLFKTRDGGRTWLPLSLPKVDGFFSAVDFLQGGNVGWVGGSVCGPLHKDEGTANRFYCSEKTASFAAVFITYDGGHTWQRQPVSRRTGDIGYLEMRDARSGLAIGQAGAFRYEGGKWLAAEQQELQGDDERSYGDSCLGIAIGMPTFCPVNFHFTDDRHGWLSNSDGYLGRTSDGGKTWTDISLCQEDGPHFDPPYFSQFYMATDGYGVALDSDNALQVTNDGGVTWESVTDQGAFGSLFALDTEKVWLVGADGVYRMKAKVTVG